MYSSGGLFATKMDIKRPFEIRIVAKFSTFYGKYGQWTFSSQNYAFFFVVTKFYAVYKLYKKTDVFRQDNVPNDCCHDNFYEIFCNLYDNYDRNY